LLKINSACRPLRLPPRSYKRMLPAGPYISLLSLLALPSRRFTAELHQSSSKITTAKSLLADFFILHLLLPVPASFFWRPLEASTPTSFSAAHDLNQGVSAASIKSPAPEGLANVDSLMSIASWPSTVKHWCEAFLSLSFHGLQPTADGVHLLSIIHRVLRLLFIPYRS